MTPRNLLVWLATAMFLSLPARAADDGHNHDAAPAAPTGPALPRFAATSDLFELVGVVNGKQLTVYLDRFDDNSPVKDAKVDLDIGGAKVVLKEHEPGEFEGNLASEVKAGVTAVTATVVAGSHTDLLAGELDVHEDAHAEVAHSHSWREYVGWGVAVAAALGVVAWAVRRRVVSRQARAGGAA